MALLSCLALGAVVLQGGGLDSLRLPAALAFARSHRGTLVVAEAGLAEAAAAARQGRAVANPTGRYGYNQSPPTQTVALQQSFDWFAQRGATRAVGRAAVARAVADSQLAAVDLDIEVRRAWYGALAAEFARGIAAGRLAVADSAERVAARRVAAGDLAAMDHDRLRLEQALAGQGLSAATEGAAVARVRLQRALGWPDTAAWPPLAGTLADGLDDPVPPAAGVERLPAVGAARAERALARAALRLASAGRWPVPSLELGIQWGDPTAPGRQLWLVGVSLPLPVFDRGGAAVAGARARLQRSVALLDEARLDARMRVATAAARLEEATRRARLASEVLLPQAGLVRERAARAYALGETGIVPLLEALRAEREAIAGAVGDLLGFQEARVSWAAIAAGAEP